MKPIPILYSASGPLDYRIAAESEPVPRQAIRENDSAEGLYLALGPPSHQETLPIGIVDARYYSNSVIALVHQGRQIVLGFYLADDRSTEHPWTHWPEVRIDRSARDASREEIVVRVPWRLSDKKYVMGCEAVNYMIALGEE